jgi:hypothetical protein
MLLEAGRSFAQHLSVAAVAGYDHDIRHEKRASAGLGQSCGNGESFFTGTPLPFHPDVVRASHAFG